MAFDNIVDAKRVLAVLGKRLARFGLRFGADAALPDDLMKLALMRRPIGLLSAMRGAVRGPCFAPPRPARARGPPSYAPIPDVGVPHGVELDGQWLFFSQTGMLGGPAPVRRFLPHLIDLVLQRKTGP